jgi:hypothetical protein
MYNIGPLWLFARTVPSAQFLDDEFLVALSLKRFVRMWTNYFDVRSLTNCPEKASCGARCYNVRHPSYRRPTCRHYKKVILSTLSKVSNGQQYICMYIRNFDVDELVVDE